MPRLTRLSSNPKLHNRPLKMQPKPVFKPHSGASAGHPRVVRRNRPHCVQSSVFSQPSQEPRSQAQPGPSRRHLAVARVVCTAVGMPEEGGVSTWCFPRTVPKKSQSRPKNMGSPSRQNSTSCHTGARRHSKPLVMAQGSDPSRSCSRPGTWKEKKGRGRGRHEPWLRDLIRLWAKCLAAQDAAQLVDLSFHKSLASSTSSSSAKSVITSEFSRVRSSTRMRNSKKVSSPSSSASSQRNLTNSSFSC